MGFNEEGARFSSGINFREKALNFTSEVSRFSDTDDDDLEKRTDAAIKNIASLYEKKDESKSRSTGRFAENGTGTGKIMDPGRDTGRGKSAGSVKAVGRFIGPSAGKDTDKDGGMDAGAGIAKAFVKGKGKGKGSPLEDKKVKAKKIKQQVQKLILHKPGPPGPIGAQGAAGPRFISQKPTENKGSEETSRSDDQQQGNDEQASGSRSITVPAGRKGDPGKMVTREPTNKPISRETRMAARRAAVAKMLKAKEAAGELGTDKATGDAFNDGNTGAVRIVTELLNPFEHAKRMLLSIAGLLAPYLFAVLMYLTVFMILISIIFGVVLELGTIEVQ